MGMRSGDDAASAARPLLVLVAAVVLAAEAAALLAYTVLNVIDIATNNSYQVSNAVALVIMQAIVIAGLAWIASGLARLRPWTRTPAVMVQAFIAVVAVILFQAHRYDWAVPTLLMAAAGLISLLAPPSLRALARREPDREEQASAPAKASKAAMPTRAAKRSGNPAKRNPAGKPVSRQS